SERRLRRRVGAIARNTGVERIVVGRADVANAFVAEWIAAAETREDDVLQASRRPFKVADQRSLGNSDDAGDRLEIALLRCTACLRLEVHSRALIDASGEFGTRHLDVERQTLPQGILKLTRQRMVAADHFVDNPKVEPEIV